MCVLYLSGVLQFYRMYHLVYSFYQAFYNFTTYISRFTLHVHTMCLLHLSGVLQYYHIYKSVYSFSIEFFSQILQQLPTMCANSSEDVRDLLWWHRRYRGHRTIGHSSQKVFSLVLWSLLAATCRIEDSTRRCEHEMSGKIRQLQPCNVVEITTKVAFITFNWKKQKDIFSPLLFLTSPSPHCPSLPFPV